MRPLAATLFLAILLSGPAFASSYLRTDGTVVDPIQYSPICCSPGAHPYSGVDLGPGVLIDDSLSGADLTGANLQNVTTPGGVDFREALLLNADLRNASLQNASFFEAEAANADFSGADLRGAGMGGSFDAASFVGADLRDSSGEDVGMTDANLSNADLTDAYWEFTYGRRANFSDATMVGFGAFYFPANGASFVNANLSSASISSFEVEGANFSGAILANMIGLELSYGIALYDSATDFSGTGFDPVAAGWTLIPEPTAAILLGLGLIALSSPNRQTLGSWR